MISKQQRLQKSAASFSLSLYFIIKSCIRTKYEEDDSHT